MRKTGGGRAGARGAIYFSERGARIAVASRQRGRVLVSDLIEVTFPPATGGQAPPVSARAAALREALRAHKWSGGGLRLVLPKNIVTMRLVTLPSTQDAELAEMAKFEAHKHIPFNVERHVIGHAVLRKEGVEGSRTLVVAVDRAALEDPLAICREAKIELVSAHVSSLALVEALLLEPPREFERRTFGVVNIGWSAVDITIVSNGIVRFSRSGTMGVGRITPVLEQMLGGTVTIGREHLEALNAFAPEAFTGRRDFAAAAREPEKPTFVVDDFAEEEALEAAAQSAPRRTGLLEAESSPPAPAHEAGGSGPAADVTHWLDRLVQEVQRTYTFAAREFDCPELDAVYLAGIGAHIGNLTAYLQESLHRPVQVIAPPAVVTFAKRPPRDLAASWSEFAVPIGAAAGEVLPPINLLPPEYTERIRARRRKRSLVVSGMLGLLLLIVSATYGGRYMADQARQLTFYREQNVFLEPREKRLRDRKNRLDNMKQIMGDKLSASAVLEAVSGIDLITQNPPQVTLTDFHYTKARAVEEPSVVVLEGHALNFTVVNQFLEKLKALKIFEDVTVQDQSSYKLPTNRYPEPVVQYRIRGILMKKKA